MGAISLLTGDTDAFCFFRAEKVGCMIVFGFFHETDEMRGEMNCQLSNYIPVVCELIQRDSSIKRLVNYKLLLVGDTI